jgi:hypothetical protein
MIKLSYLRPEDYWIFPLSIISIAAIVFMVYASPFTFRLPAAIVGLGLLWFTAHEVKKGYDKNHAWLHVAICTVLSVLLFIGLFSLTN